MIKILTTFGSLVATGFGIWHFFVPKIWNWYAYMDQSATELVLAVRAINVFFSLSLVLLGIANVLFVFKVPQEKFSLLVMLSVSTVLWTTRVIMQIVYPQGAHSAVLQYGMLVSFVLVCACFALSLYLLWRKK